MSAGSSIIERTDAVRPNRLVRAVYWYQRAMEGRPSPCRFTPSCSSYAREALTVHGTRRGLWLTARRLLRCRPLGPSGFDPVPEASDSPTEER
jgi:putative membrane protein insertion efficiency factor